jgi:hypothetical protein
MTRHAVLTAARGLAIAAMVLGVARGTALGQAAPASAPAQPAPESPRPAARAADDRRPQAGVRFDTNTDGESSWLQVTPTGGLAWGRRWSVEAGLPIFHLAGSATGTGVAQTGLGDFYASVSFDVSGAGTTAYLTGTLGLPTGDVDGGLGAGTATWDVSGYVDRTWSRLTSSLELGVGNNGLVAAPSPARQLFQAPGALFHAEGWAEVAVWRALRLSAGVYVFRSLVSASVAGPLEDRGAEEDSGDDEGYQFVAATDVTPALELSLWVSRSVPYAYNTYAVSLGVDIVRMVSRRGTAPQDRRR